MNKFLQVGDKFMPELHLKQQIPETKKELISLFSQEIQI